MSEVLKCGELPDVGGIIFDTQAIRTAPRGGIGPERAAVSSFRTDGMGTDA